MQHADRAPRRAAAASASISSDGLSAKTSTSAPAAERSSAFQAAAGVPPASTARLPASAKKTGRRASGSMRGVRRLNGLRDGVHGDDPLELGQARAAIGAGAQASADVGDVRAAPDATASRTLSTPTPKQAQITGPLSAGIAVETRRTDRPPPSAMSAAASNTSASGGGMSAGPRQMQLRSRRRRKPQRGSSRPSSCSASAASAASKRSAKSCQTIGPWLGARRYSAPSAMATRAHQVPFGSAIGRRARRETAQVERRPARSPPASPWLPAGRRTDRSAARHEIADPARRTRSRRSSGSARTASPAAGLR